MTLEAAHSEISAGHHQQPAGALSGMRNCCTTRSSVPGGTISESRFPLRRRRIARRLDQDGGSRGEDWEEREQRRIGRSFGDAESVVVEGGNGASPQEKPDGAEVKAHGGGAAKTLVGRRKRLPHKYVGPLDDKVGQTPSSSNPTDLPIPALMALLQDDFGHAGVVGAVGHPDHQQMLAGRQAGEIQREPLAQGIDDAVGGFHRHPAAASSEYSQRRSGDAASAASIPRAPWPRRAARSPKVTTGGVLSISHRRADQLRRRAAVAGGLASRSEATTRK